MMNNSTTFIDFIALGLIRDIELLASNENCVLWIRDKEEYSQLYLSSNYQEFWGHTNLSLYRDPDSWRNSLNASNTELLNEEIRLQRMVLSPDYTAIYSIKHPDNHELWFQDRSVQLHAISKKVIIVGCAIPVQDKEALVTHQRDLAERLDSIITQFCNMLVQGVVPKEQTMVLEDNEFSQLSNREKELFKLFLKGMTIAAASQVLHLSPRTIETYLNNLKFKLNCDSKSEIIMKAIEKGWLSLNL